MIKTIIFTLYTLLVILLFSPNSLTLSQINFQSWAQKYGKTYLSSQQFMYRSAVFTYNQIKVSKHNEKAERGEQTYFLKLNQFADLTQFQFKHLYGHLMMKSPIPENITNQCNGSIADAPNPPQTLNWTSTAVQKNVMNEGLCAANWAISAIGAIEGLYALKIQNLVKFSEQQLIDCSGEYGNEGCGGGFMDQSYWYLIDQGLATNKSYPYTGKASKCKYSQAIKATNFTRCARVPTNSYDKLLSAVVQQPVSVAVASASFMLYDRGIYTGDCGTEIDRGMLLVGYGTQSSTDFWIIKNSLGVNWGQKGYIRLKKTSKSGPGMCGIQIAASVPLSIVS